MWIAVGATRCNPPDEASSRYGPRRREQDMNVGLFDDAVIPCDSTVHEKPPPFDRVELTGLRLSTLPHHRMCRFRRTAVESSGPLHCSRKV